jgi:hypothetical protein
MVDFHSQQCIEKSLKAIIEEYEIGPFRILSLETLLEVIRHKAKLDMDPVLIHPPKPIAPPPLHRLLPIAHRLPSTLNFAATAP